MRTTKTLSYLIIFLSLVSLSFAAVVEEYHDNNDNNQIWIDKNVSQSFQLDNHSYVTGIRLSFGAVTPGGNITVQIEEDIGGIPNGERATTGAISIRTTFTNNTNNTFNFNQIVRLDSSTTYHITGYGNGSVAALTKQQNPGGYASGTVSEQAGGAWTNQALDLNFEVLGWFADDEGTTTFNLIQRNTGASVEGATIRQYKTVGGTEYLMADKLSDITGRQQFLYEENDDYRFTITKSGYVAKEFNLTPVFSNYNILLDPISTTNTSSFFDDITVSIDDHRLANENTSYVTATFTSAGGTLIGYTLNVSTPYNESYVSGNDAYGNRLNATLQINGAVFGDVATITYIFNSTLNAGNVTRIILLPISAGSAVGTLEGIKKDAETLGDLEKTIIATIFVLIFAAAGGLAGSLVGESLMFSAIAGTGVLGIFAKIGFINPYVFYLVAFIAIMMVAGKMVMR